MLKTIANLDQDAALDVLAEAGAVLRPAAPEEAAPVSEEAVLTLSEAARQAGLDLPTIGVLEARDFADLAAGDATVLLGILNENIAAIALHDVDLESALKRFAAPPPVRPTDPVPRRIEVRAYVRSNLRSLAAVLAFGSLAFAAAHFKGVADQALGDSSLKGRRISALAGEVDSARQREAALQAEVDSAKQREAALQAEVERLSRQVTRLTGAVPAVAYTLNCQGLKGTLDSSGWLDLKLPAVAEGQTYKVTAEGRAAEGPLTWTGEFSSVKGDLGEAELRQHTPLRSILKLTLTGPNIDIVCAAGRR